MSFTFRKEELKVPFFCVDISDEEGKKMVPTGDRFDFHETTRSNFTFKSGQDLCHRYSFSAMAQLLCLIYNSEDYSKLERLIATLFPYNNNDRKNVFEVYEKIISKPVKAVKYFNQLLYILNNSLLNLRPGDSGWNRSIGLCYDPEEWKFNGEKFVITNEIDVFIISNLLQINVDQPTIYFYTATDANGNPILYSSNNDFKNEGISEYQKLDIPICIYPLDENGVEFEMIIT